MGEKNNILELTNRSRGDDGLSNSSPLAGRRDLPLAARPSISKKIQRRQKILAEFNALVSAGATKVAAAKQIRQSTVTLWRWQRRLIPRSPCGRASSFDRFQIPRPVLIRVERLQLTGKSNARAWRAVAGEPICPPELSEFLRTTKNIPPSFQRATRLHREKVVMVRGKNFVTIET